MTVIGAAAFALRAAVSGLEDAELDQPGVSPMLTTS
jgi:hypothetical protein